MLTINNKTGSYAIILTQFSLKKHKEEPVLKRLYTSILFVALPIILLRLIWRGLKSPAYFKRWSERFGKSPNLSKDKPVIWVHSVSIGEVEASRPLIKSLQETFPEHQLLITTMTPTGSERVKLLFKDKVAHCYLPYDVPFAVQKFLRATRPQFGILMETEIWPNMIAECHKQNISLILANARMSARSQKGYQCFAKFTKSTLNQLSLIATQTEPDRQRFQQLGANSQKVHTVGNLKFEVNLPASIKEQAEIIRAMWDCNRPVWMAASTHEGEEEIILNASRQIRSIFPDLLLIIVPRHPERFDRVTGLCQKAGFITLRRSEQKPCSSKIQVLVIDRMGELPLFYSACDVALIGGSLIPHGGHNLLEPAALGRAVITGPHYFNFNEITKQFLKSHALLEVHNTEQLAASVTMLLENPQKRAEMGEAGLLLISRSQGASIRLMNLIKRHIA